MKSITCIQKIVLYVERVSLYWNILYTQMKMPIHTSTFSVHAISVWNMARFFASPKRCRLLTEIFGWEVCSSGSIRPLCSVPPVALQRHIHCLYTCVCVRVCVSIIESNFMCMDLYSHTQPKLDIRYKKIYSQFGWLNRSSRFRIRFLPLIRHFLVGVQSNWSKWQIRWSLLRTRAAQYHSIVCVCGPSRWYIDSIYWRFGRFVQPSSS